MCHLRDQLQRAASSICLNLAEGYARISPRDKLRFFAISMGSVRECQALLDIATINPENSQLLDAVAASLYRLIQVMQTRA